MKLPPPPHPWQRAAWEQLVIARQHNRMAQALLIHGPRHGGKRAFALALARGGLCEVPDPQLRSCGQCPACMQCQVGSHPDFALIEPAPDKREILVEQIREFRGKMQLTGSRSSRRFGVVIGADRMHVSAANAFLKTLEEPPTGVTLVLTAERLSVVPATIRSRCQLLAMPRATRAEAETWLHGVEPGAIAGLESAGGSPLLALHRSEADVSAREGRWRICVAHLASERADPVSAAGQIDDGAWPEFLDWWQIHLFEQAQKVDPAQRSAYFKVWDAIAATKRGSRTPINRLLALEGLFILFVTETRRARSAPRTS